MGPFLMVTAGHPVLPCIDEQMPIREHTTLLACMYAKIYAHMEVQPVGYIYTEPHGICNANFPPARHSGFFYLSLISVFSQSDLLQIYPMSNIRLIACRNLLKETREGSKTGTV